MKPKFSMKNFKTGFDASIINYMEQNAYSSPAINNPYIEKDQMITPFVKIKERFQDSSNQVSNKY